VLFVLEEIARPIAGALEHSIGVIATAEVLPALDMLYLIDHPESSIHKFHSFRSDSRLSVTFLNTLHQEKASTLK
jgi:hypothetical protein